jgi:hypothetical protein
VFYITTTPLITNTKGPAMNTKSLSVALAIAAGSVLASMTASAAPITTLDTLQVRPSAEQIAQHTYEINSNIPTLAAVQVRPSAEQLAQYDAEQAARSNVVTLAAIEVRPSAEQRAEMLASRDESSTASRSVASEASAAVVALIGQVVINLPVPSLQPSPADLDALIGTIGQFVRY